MHQVTEISKNMITGASQADAAVLCAANDGVNAPNKEALFLLIGVSQLIIT